MSELNRAVRVLCLLGCATTLACDDASGEQTADRVDSGASDTGAMQTDAGAGEADAGARQTDAGADETDTGAGDLGCAEQTSTTPGLVSTRLGDIQGRQEDNGVWRFLGIPFAEPPVGDLRWRPPAEPGCFEAPPFVADAFGPPCPQIRDGAPVGEEDCLHLNVWTPADYSADSRRPVMVYIHGGANILGSTSDGFGPDRPAYTGKFLAEREDVVVVTIQYRLGPLGFLALPELSAESEQGASGHYAHLDQIAALKWVREHITRFGGDTERVLVFGQSGGAINTCTLLASPLARGLFTSALLQSGACSFRTLEQSEAQHDVGVELLDECVDAPDRLACLRGLPFDRIVSTIPGSIGVGVGESVEGGEGMVYGPVVDGYLLPDAPLALIERGEHNDVPLVLGSTADEMASENIFQAEVETVEAYEAFIRGAFSGYGEEAVATILELYPASDYETPQDALIQVFTDRSFTRQARLLARAAAAGGTAPTFRYLFSKNTDTPAGTIPARHGIDLTYVFNTITTIPVFNPTPADTAIADAMMASWAALARSGDPNAEALGVAWQPYDPARDNYVDFGATVSADEGLRTQKCDMWDALLDP